MDYALVYITILSLGMVTNRFDKFHDALWQFDWYFMPIKMQQIYLLFMLNCQHPVIIRGLANIWCTRETFKSVSISLNFEFWVLNWKLFVHLKCNNLYSFLTVTDSENGVFVFHGTPPIWLKHFQRNSNLFQGNVWATKFWMKKLLESNNLFNILFVCLLI